MENRLTNKMTPILIGIELGVGQQSRGLGAKPSKKIMCYVIAYTILIFCCLHALISIMRSILNTLTYR